jgi:23S rRNA (cytosine1962-C5)-methyltransferase
MTEQREQSSRLRLRVTAAAESTIRSGHPWVYAESVREQNRVGAAGDLAVIYDRKDRFLAVGLFDPGSPIRVRVLHSGKPQAIDRHWWAQRLVEALRRRTGLFDSHTTGFRWINGESDGWPGLVLDKYDQTLVLKLYTAAWLPYLGVIVSLLQQQLQPGRIVLRLSRNVQRTAAAFSATDGQILAGPALSGPVVFLENGIHFEADVLRGQKTGFFLDQRENRSRVEQFASGRSVLNTFSFSGAFSLYAARGGARSVTDVDISPHALTAARRNFSLNQSVRPIAACQYDNVQADAFDWLGGTELQFDLIILDPPSLAKREAERAGAIRAYGKLADLGMRRLLPGGILVACSCSAHVSQNEFFGVVRKAAATAGGYNELKTAGHAPDHPARIMEAQYLKAIYLQRTR